MNINLLNEKLIRVARTNRISDSVPYAFEKRILAHIRTQPALDTVAWWTRALWRAAVACVVVMLMFSAWPVATPNPSTPSNVTEVADFSIDLQTTLMASVDMDNDLIW